MKKLLVIVSALTLAFGPSVQLLAKADKACWTTASQQWPEPTLGWHPLVPNVGQYSGGAVAVVNYASLAYSTLLVKITTRINGVSTSNYYTNTSNGFSYTPEWRGSITLPEQVLCNLPGNYGQVQVWAYYPDKSVGSSEFYAYAAAKIQGN